MSFRISLSPSKRAAARFVERARRALLKALSEEADKRGLTQADIARTIGVDRSVIHRELRGHKDITMGRVAELASAMGRRVDLTFPPLQQPTGNWTPSIRSVTSVDVAANNNTKFAVKEAAI